MGLSRSLRLFFWSAGLVAYFYYFFLYRCRFLIRSLSLLLSLSFSHVSSALSHFILSMRTSSWLFLQLADKLNPFSHAYGGCSLTEPQIIVSCMCVCASTCVYACACAPCVCVCVMHVLSMHVCMDVCVFVCLGWLDGRHVGNLLGPRELLAAPDCSKGRPAAAEQGR